MYVRDFYKYTWMRPKWSGFIEMMILSEQLIIIKGVVIYKSGRGVEVNFQQARVAGSLGCGAKRNT